MRPQHSPVSHRNEYHDSSRTAATSSNAGTRGPRSNARDRRPGHPAFGPRRTRGPLSHAAGHYPRPRHTTAPRLFALFRLRGRPVPRVPGRPAAWRGCVGEGAFSDYWSHCWRLANSDLARAEVQKDHSDWDEACVCPRIAKTCLPAKSPARTIAMSARKCCLFPQRSCGNISPRFGGERFASFRSNRASLCRNGRARIRRLPVGT
jgi:hypothetical protein